MRGNTYSFGLFSFLRKAAGREVVFLLASLFFILWPKRIPRILGMKGRQKPLDGNPGRIRNIEKSQIFISVEEQPNVTRMTSVLPASAAVETAVGAAGDHEQPMFVNVIAATCGVWVLCVVLVQIIGFTQLYD
jgi:hypothetical protein